MNNLVIPHNKLSKSDVFEISQELSAANLILKKYHQKMTIRKGRKGYRDSEGNSFTVIDLLNLIYKNKKEDRVEVKGILIDVEDVEKLCDIKEKEYLLLSNYSHMFYTLSKKHFLSTSLYDMEDLQNECITASLKAMYGYFESDKHSNQRASLFTFLYRSVNNHLIKLSRTMLSSLDRKAVKIKCRFIDLKNENPNLTFDDLVSKLNLSPKELKILTCALSSTVYRESDYNREDGDNFLGIANQVAVEEERKEEELDVEPFVMKNMEEIICTLSELEKQVLRGYLNEKFPSSKKSNRGIGKFAKDLINPKTNKPYSRMAISYAWKRVQEKIKKAA